MALVESSINLEVGKVNPDLQKERDGASFNPNDMTLVLLGGPKRAQHRREVVRQLFSDPVFNQEMRYSQSKTERYDQAMHQSIRLAEYMIEKGWTDKEMQTAAVALHYDLATAVHAVMFVPTILRLATPEQQAEWLPQAASFKMIGTYAQTELGHGTNLKALETTATYDRSSECFIMNTPLPSGMKWWPGGLGKSTTHALVTANLIVDGQSHGFQVFLVQLRDVETFEELPGIEVGDIGPRISVSVTDNGYLIMRNVKIPRNNMLSKYCTVTSEGKFLRQEGTAKSNYGTMMMVRASIVDLAFQNTSQAVTIATRYGAVRRQSELKPGAKEPQIIDFVTQQYKLIPNIALAYGLHFTKEYMLSYYHQVFEEEIQKGVYDSVPELHSQSCGLKAYCTDLSMDTVEVCRRSCGGHGFMMASGLCSLLMDGLGSVTYEGENTVLYLQTARFLMKNYAAAMQGGRTARSLAFLTANHPTCELLDVFNLPQLQAVFDVRAKFMLECGAVRMSESLKNGRQQYEAWNENSVELVRASKAYLDSFTAVNFMKRVSTLDIKPELKDVLMKLCRLHALHRIVSSAEEFLQSMAINTKQLEDIRSAEIKLLASLRPDAVALVDSFDYHDQTLNSALGRYDGNVYEKMYDLTKRNPMNEQSVHPAIHKYLKPFQAKARL
ncbi:hypothetical protein CAPTEDRAFT_178214 [Capitella teleta]|uniref:Acyl-coenzyme A oxidase n=1 Tax=Capitella teleta TaxID=283909 RepID=R7U5U2_CAPTE|nr:hypothetical protein CAPTEDRAFT_178214 [Capitella teleta]|eukprot:ELU01431.1 hypothetical protein CAPTEDRAFT_178214 [Capitella teleta]